MKSGEEYEKLSEEVVRALNHGKKVTHNVKIIGKLTEIERQVDVKLDESDYDFVMYECKDWGKSIGVGVVGQFITDLEDVGAMRGAIIANSPYTKGSLNLAKKKGVTLLHLVKTDHPKPRMGIAAIVLAREKIIDAISFGVQDSSFNAPLLSMDPDEFIIVDKSKSLSINSYIRKRWNEGLNSSSKLGNNHYEISQARIIDIKGDEYVVDIVSFDLVVTEELYEGKWLIEEAQGLYNALDNSFHAYGNMKSAKLSIDEMEKSFKKIDPNDASRRDYSIILSIGSEYH